MNPHEIYSTQTTHSDQTNLAPNAAVHLNVQWP
jgi:hypothetical protein